MADIDKLSIQISATTGRAVSNVNKLATALEGLATALNAIDPSKLQVATQAANDMNTAISGLKGSGKSVQTIANGFSQIGQQSGNVVKTTSAIDGVATAATNAASGVRNATSSITGIGEAGSRSASGVGKLSDVTKQTSTNSQTLSKRLSDVTSTLKRINSAFNKVASGAFKSASGMKSFGNSAKSSKVSAASLVKELTRVTKMLKLMVTRMILRKVIQGVLDGFKNLAQYSSSFDATLSLLWNDFKQLGNSIAAAVSPLLSALAPALHYIIQLVIKAVNAINQLISALMGLTSWKKAKTLTDDYADSLDKAGGKAKELKKTLLGFDEINQLQDNKSSGGGGTNPKDMFEDVPISDKWKKLADYIKNLAKKLFEPIKKAWEKVGDFVKKSWKYAMDEVLKLGKSIAKDFWKVWQQPQTQKIFENILTTIGYIGQAVGNLAKRFHEAWDYNDTGLHILEAIRDIVLIVTEHLKNMAIATAKWADNLDFTPLLTAFKKWLESMKPVVDAIAGAFEDFYTQVLLPLGEWAIEKGLPELIQVFTDLNNKIDWEGLREKFSEVWVYLERFAETVGEGLIIFIKDVSNAVANFINSDTFTDFLDAVKRWMDSVDAEEVARTLKLVAGAIITLKGALFLLEGLKGINTIVTTLKTFFGLFAAGGVGAGASATLTDIGTSINGLSGTLGTLAANIGVFETLINLLERMDKIDDLKILDNPTPEKIKERTDKLKDHVESLKEYEGIGGRVILQGYTWRDAWKDFKNPFNDVNIGLSLLESNMKGVTHDTEEYLKSIGYTDAEIKNFKTTLNGLNGVVVETTDTAKKSSKVVTQDIPMEVYDAQVSISGTVQTLSKNVDTETKKGFDAAGKNSKVFVDDMPKDVTEAQKSMSGSVETLNKDFDTNMGDVKKTVQDTTDDINKNLDTIKDGMTEDKWTFSGIADGLKKSFEAAKEAIKGVWNSIAEKLNGDYQIGDIKLPIHLPTFAGGGFPENGLFMANSTEMVGRFSNGRTAVANNEQITNGIAQAVFNAITSANAQGGNEKYINNTIYIDDVAVARAVTKGQEKLNRRYSPTMA